MIDEGPASLSPTIDTFDSSQADTPAGTAALLILFRLLASRFARSVLAFILIILFTYLMLHDARAQIPGTLFATVSFILVIVAAMILATLTESRAPVLGRLFFGRPIASPKTAQRRVLQLAMQSAQGYEYTFSPDVQAAVDRYEALDRQLGEQKAAAGDGDLQALLAFADPRTGTTVREIMRTRNIEFGGALLHLGTLGMFAAQLSAIAFGLLAIIAVLQADDRVARVTFVQLGIGLVLFSAVLVILMLQVQLSRTQIMGIENLEALMSDADRVLLNRIKEKWFYPTVTVKPKFYSALRRYLVLLHMPLILRDLVFFGFMLLCAALVTLLWPGTVKDWTGEFSQTFELLVITAVLYIGAFWVALKVLESLRDVLQPAFVSIVTAAGTVLLMFIGTGSFEISAAIASIGAAFPASIATGFASAFWKGRR